MTPYRARGRCFDGGDELEVFVYRLQAAGRLHAAARLDAQVRTNPRGGFTARGDARWRLGPPVRHWSRRVIASPDPTPHGRWRRDARPTTAVAAPPAWQRGTRRERIESSIVRTSAQPTTASESSGSRSPSANRPDQVEPIVAQEPARRDQRPAVPPSPDRQDVTDHGSSLG